MDIIDKKIQIIDRLKNTDSVVIGVLAKITTRAEIGLKKYNTNMDRTDLSLIDWFNHLQEEVMDMLIYMEKIKQELILKTKTDR